MDQCSRICRNLFHTAGFHQRLRSGDKMNEAIVKVVEYPETCIVLKINDIQVYHLKKSDENALEMYRLSQKIQSALRIPTGEKQND